LARAERLTGRACATDIAGEEHLSLASGQTCRFDGAHCAEQRRACFQREDLMRRKLLCAATLVAGATATTSAVAQEDLTIALIPGLTTDAFYITMRKGAQHAADALGVELIFQGGPDFNPTVQVPVLNAVTARQPDAILIAPTDKQQLIAPLKQAHDAGIKIITVDTFIDDGRYQDDEGPGDFPLSYVASDNVLGGFMAGAALGKALGGEGKVYVSNVKPGISTTDQREEGF
jgi:ribose transport system substrate-binding protein